MPTRTHVEMVWTNTVAQAYAFETLGQFNHAVSKLSDDLAGRPREEIQQGVRALLRDWEVNLEVAAQLWRKHTIARTTITPG